MHTLIIDHRTVKTIPYKGYLINVIQSKTIVMSTVYQATNNTGEPYLYHPWFATIDEAINWDRKNIDAYIKDIT